MLIFSKRKNPLKLPLAIGAALLMPLFTSSQALPPPPKATLLPASLSVDIAHDGAPVDLTAALSNTGGGVLTWRVGAIRDVSAATAPAVAAGPIAAARLYDKAGLERGSYVSGEIIVAVKEADASVPSAKAGAPPSFLGGKAKIKREMIQARRVARAGAAGRAAAPAPRPGRKLYLITVEDPSKAGMEKAISELRKDPNVAYAEPNYRLKAIGLPNDPDFNLLYGLHNSGQTGGLADADIDAPEAWDTYTGDQNVIVGVIDTGIDYLHPDLVDNIWTNPGEIPGNGLDDDGNGYVDDVHGYDFVNHDSDPMDDHYHGTHVSGTIAASGDNGVGVVGVAWKARLAALKFLDAFGSGTTDGAIEAVAYANAMDIPITSNSWGGGGFSQALKDVIDAGGERGFLFVAAAGNESSNTDQFPAYPASYESESIVSVAATDSWDELAGFSNYGVVTVDLGAPGVDTYSCAPGGGYQYLSGTSMATPHVSGAAALLKSFNPQLGYAEIKAALLAGVDPIPSLSGRVLSNGRLNLEKALGGVSPPWVSVAPRGPGEIAAGASQVLTATVDPKGLTAGEHKAVVQIATNDPASPIRELEVIARVSACRSLSVSPASLDFGGVWQGATKRLSLTLINSCNDSTRLESAESSLKMFASAGALPLKIPPFGKATLAVIYTPDDLAPDQAVLTLKSDAEDHPLLTVGLQGIGLVPPKVAVDPERFELTLDPAEHADRKLLIRNTGGDILSVKLSTEAKKPAGTAKAGMAASKPRGPGALIPGTAPAGKPWASGAGKAKPANLRPALKASASDLKVLYLTTLLRQGAEDDLVRGLRGLPSVGSLEVVDGTSATPDLEYLQNYDLVLVSANSTWADAFLVGNILADYVDEGGEVCLMVAAIASGGGYSLRGRITEPEYLPLEMSGPGLGGEATEFEVHPITAGVQSILGYIPTSATRTQGAGLALGRYPDGSLVGAVNPDKPVVAVNIYPQDGYWGGDLILLMGNAFDYLDGNSGWLRLEPRKADIAPGGSMEFTLSFSAERQLAGDHESVLKISHNAPAGDNPLLVPVLMHVRGVSHLAMSLPKFDFGGVLVNGQGRTTLTLSNSGNQTTTVSGLASEPPFSSSTPVPILVPAFSKADLELVFSPVTEGYATGTVTLTSDAADHPVLSLPVRGQGLPAPEVSLKPENLSVTLAWNASPVDLTSTLSNLGRGVLRYNVGSPKDVTPAVAPPAPKAVRTELVYDAANYDRAAVPGQLLVGLKEGQASVANSASLGALGIKLMRNVMRAVPPKGKAGYAPGRKILLISIADGSRAGVLKAISELRKDPNVAYAEPNYRLKAIGLPNDPDFNLLYGLHNSGQTGGLADADIDAPEAWDTYTGDQNVIVGVIDTGIDYLHPDLVDNIWTNPGEIPGNGLDDDGNGYVDDVHGYDFVNHDSDPMDDHYHGTHVSGTIAASGDNGVGVVGVAWKARLAALKFLDAFGSGTTDGAIEAVAYANAMDIPITSNSWGGGGFSQALKDVIDAGGERGLLFVAAAGNESSNTDQFPAYPASYESESIVSVAATDSWDELAGFSNYGVVTVDLGAPGVDTYSCAPGGGYQYLSGTSMATPHVSGAAALLKSFNPQLGYAEIKAALLAGVDPIPSLSGRVLSNGRLNLEKALGGISPPWVSIKPRGQGELAAGASQVLTATVDPKGLTAGEHKAVVRITTNDPKTPVKELQVKAEVSGCRSLTVTPSALDFGIVWTGSTKRLALTLVNKCNDFTEVSAVESSHKTFTKASSLPLRVPPFGSASLEIAYAPDDLSPDKALLTLKSNAQDNPILKVSAKGTGVKPPAIKVDPPSLSLTLDPSEQKTSAIKVSNKGGADLVLSLKLALEKKKAAGPAPKLTATDRKSGARYAQSRGTLSPRSLHPMIQASASGLKVLYLTTLFQYDSTGDAFTQGLRGLPQVAQLDLVDGGVSVPNADFLAGYDVVIVSADYPWADALATGDALADYVDNGGSVCLMVAAIASGGGYELLGRIATPDYLPMVKEGPGYTGFAKEFADHPITVGMIGLESYLPTASGQTQGGGISLGQYDNGSLIGAVNTDDNVVAINVFPADGMWSGDLILMLSNTLDFLATGTRWVKVEPAKLVVPAGKTLEARLTFDTEKLEAGSYAAILNLAHNAPAGSNPLAVPLALTVTAKRCLEASVSSLDFGKVWSGNRGLAKVILSNPCNRPTKVSALSNSAKMFSTSAKAPFEVAAFSETSLELTYIPDDLNPDKGTFTVKSDAKDHPVIAIALKGTGVKPPAISVKPGSLALTLDPGAKAGKTLDIHNAGGDSLRVKVDAKAVEDAGKTAEPPRLTPGRAATSRPLVGQARAPLPHSSARTFRPRAGGSLNVLYLNSMGLPPDGDGFVKGLRELANVGSVDLVDAQFETPNAGYLLGYDVVMVATDYPPADPVALGDALADYVDGGGKVILSAAASYKDGPWGIAGRFSDPAYTPLAGYYVTGSGSSRTLVDHPINAGVQYLYSELALYADSAQGTGLPLGEFEYSILTGAYNTEKPVVAINFYPIDGYWGGDYLLLLGNTLEFLGPSIRWMKPAISELVVPPGKTFKLNVAFNASDLDAGRYLGLLSFEHNAPLNPAPVEVPVTLQVRSKRCLAAEPAFLDFGKVWKGASGTQALSLANHCNEAVQVDAIRSEDASFSLGQKAPLVVPAFSAVEIQVTFAPKDLKTHQSSLAIASNAEDNSNLCVPVKGQGTPPPAIAVNPSSLKESVKAGEVKTRAITVSNQGGDYLEVFLQASVQADGKAAAEPGQSALIPGPGRRLPGGAPYSPGRPIISYKRLADTTAPNPDGLKVLFFHTLFPDGYENKFTYGLRGLPNVSSLDVVNGEYLTPNAAYFQAYDQVVVASNYYFADAVALGDALADYVDQGGRVCLMTAAISNMTGVGLQGRIASPGYMPMVQEGPGKGGMVISFEDHPINAGIQHLYSFSSTTSTQVQGDGHPLGYLQDGSLLGAWNSAKPVVALNVFPDDWGWEGDLVPMLGNVFDYLSKSSWMSVEPRTLRVAPGKSAEAVVRFDGANVAAGSHSGLLTLNHNVPGKSALIVSATLMVDSRLGLEASVKSLDFGAVVIGRVNSIQMSLKNTGNLPATVAASLKGNPAFDLVSNPFPLILEPGEAFPFWVRFEPTQSSSAPATLAFTTEGLAPVEVALKGTGLRPALMSASISPNPFKITVPMGGGFSGAFNLANLGEEVFYYNLNLTFAPDASLTVVSANIPAYGPEHFQPLAKGAVDFRVGKPVDLTTGGPDAFGYHWFDSREPGGPAYSWVEISETGRRLEGVSMCDDCAEEVPLSFDFPLYDASGRRQIYVSSNGYLTLGSLSDGYSNHPLPALEMPQYLVAALYQDLYPPAGGAIWFQDFGDKAVVQFQGVRSFQGNGVYDFEIILYPNGTIDLQYARLNGPRNTCTVGIQNGDSKDGLQVVYNADYLEDNLAIRLRTWLGVPYRYGQVGGTGSKTLDLSVDSRGLPVGTHKGTLKLTHTASESVLTFPLELNVAPAPSKP